MFSLDMGQAREDLVHTPARAPLRSRVPSTDTSLTRSQLRSDYLGVLLNPPWASLGCNPGVTAADLARLKLTQLCPYGTVPRNLQIHAPCACPTTRQLLRRVPVRVG